MQFMRFAVLVFFVTIKQTIQECNKEICLKWTFRNERLELACHINQPYNMVHVENPDGHLVADCYPSSPNDCSTYPKFSKFYYDFGMASFIFKLKVLPDTRILGVWKCKHGRNGETAEVFIGTLSNHTEKAGTTGKRTTEQESTVYTGLENNNQQESHPTEDIERLNTEQESTTEYTSLENNNQQESHATEDIVEVLKRYGIPMGMVLISVIILGVAVKIVINQKRLSLNNQVANRQADINLHHNPSHNPTTVGVVDQEYESEHDYVSVNEDEMIPDDSALEIRPDEQDNYSDKTSANSSTDTNNPYLDVVYDFPVLNEYEKSDTVQEVSHNYTTIANSHLSNRIYINELI